MGRIIRPDGKPANAQQNSQLLVGCGIGGIRATYHLLKYTEKLTRYPGDCGIDLYPSETGEPKKIGYMSVWTVRTGVHIMLPYGAFGRLVARSSSVEKLCGGWIIDGTIDAGYTGELFIRVMGFTGLATDPDCAERQRLVQQGIQQCINLELSLAQLIVTPFFFCEFTVVNPATVGSPRGSNGFGSTDVKAPNTSNKENENE